MATTRNPFELLLVAAFGIYCAASLIAFDKVATTVLRAFPPPWALVFLAAGLVSCSITITGVIRARTMTGVLYERAGLTALAGITFAYACWAIGNTGIRALAFALMLSAIAVSSAWRSVQISRARKTAMR
jgi:hypothetical protein